MPRGVQRGSALAIAMIVLVLLSGMAIALHVLGHNEVRMSRADLRSKQVFFMAEAGLEHARMSLFATNGPGDFDDDLLAASGGPSGNNVIDFNPSALEPVFDSTGLLTGFNAGISDDVPLLGITPFADGAYAAFLTNDPVETTPSTADANGRVMITGIGAGPDRSLEVVQAILETDPIFFSTPQATVTLLGPPPVYQGGESNAKMYEGDDCGPSPSMPTIGTIGKASRNWVQAHLGKPTYKSKGLPAVQTVADLTDPSEPTVSTPIDPAWTNCLSVRDMIEEIRKVADVICTSPTCTLPPSAPERIVFVDGDWDFGDGAGTLVVTGMLNITGSPSWYGPILAIGEGDVRRVGGGSGTPRGAIVVADIAGPDDVYGTTDDCTGGSGGFDAATWHTAGGGASTIQYCAAALERAPQRLYKVTSFLQR